jgi:hypothetical protein
VKHLAPKMVPQYDSFNAVKLAQTAAPNLAAAGLLPHLP